MDVRKLTRQAAVRLAALLWHVFGVTHDPRVYKCRNCGVPCRWEHSWVTMGYAARLCGSCFSKREAFKWGAR